MFNMSDKLTHTSITPPSQYDNPDGLEIIEQFIWSGQLCMDTRNGKPIIPTPLDQNDSYDDNYSALDNLPISFGKKHFHRTPVQILAIDPQYIVWCRDNVARVFCSDELLQTARAAVLKLKQERGYV